MQTSEPEESDLETEKESSEDLDFNTSTIVVNKFKRKPSKRKKLNQQEDSEDSDDEPFFITLKRAEVEDAGDVLKEGIDTKKYKALQPYLN